MSLSNHKSASPRTRPSTSSGRTGLMRAREVNGIDASMRAGSEIVGADHTLQRLLDSPNPFWSRSDLWRATETYLSLWGSAFWGLERDEQGSVVEIWPLRPDKMRVIPDSQRYIKGFVYVGAGSEFVPYLPEGCGVDALLQPSGRVRGAFAYRARCASPRTWASTRCGRTASSCRTTARRG